MREFDVIVVGASLAGSSTALRLGQRGWRVLLLDRAVFPRSKVCGEGLMPAGVQLLSRLGVSLRTLQGRRFRGIQFHTPGRSPLQLNFTELSRSCFGLVVSRESLDQRLVYEASRPSSVEVRQGFRVAACTRSARGIEVAGDSGESFRARVVVGADGIRSRFHTWDGIRRTHTAPSRFALRALLPRFQLAENWVDVHCSPDGEAYVAPLSSGAARVTLLMNQPHELPAVSSRERFFQRLLNRFPEVARRAQCRPVKIDATAPVARSVERCHGDRLLLVGDAAGAVDPITGQGMTLALRDGVLAAEILDPALARDRLGEGDLAIYTRRRLRYFQQARELSDQVLRLVKHPWLINQARRALAENRGLRTRLLASAVNPSPASGLRWTDRVRLVAGF